MQGNKTHQQERAIIEKRENKAGGGKEFDASLHLKRTDAAREAHRKSESLHPKTGELSLNSDPSIVRGDHQESKHNK